MNTSYGERLTRLEQKVDDLPDVITQRIIEKLDSRYASKNVEKIVYSVLIIFALGSLYFIFNKVGLPY